MSTGGRGCGSPVGTNCSCGAGGEEAGRLELESWWPPSLLSILGGGQEE